MKAGTTMWTPAVKHLPENLTDGDMEVILVELKTRKRKPRRKNQLRTSRKQLKSDVPGARSSVPQRK